MLAVDPEIADLVALVPTASLDREMLPLARAWDIVPAVPLSDAVERREHVVPGDPDVVVRVHRPVGIEEALPCVYSIHGGGYIMGSYTMDDARFDHWCPKHRCVGVSVEYRLAPETPYPGPLEDCYLGLKWVCEHAEELGIDPTHIGVAGASAGGGLAAANTFGWQSYLGDLYGAPDVPAYAAPARASDLRGLPAAYVCVGAVDGFRDEDIDYAMRLNQAGVPTELHVYPGAPHGVMLFPKSTVAKRYAASIEDWIGRQLRVER